MEEQKLQSANITIQEVAAEERRIKIVDNSGKVYSIWRTRQDGTPTKAYEAFKDKALSAQGQTFGIAYSEKPNPQSAGTFFRNIVVIGNPDEKYNKESAGDLEQRVALLEKHVRAMQTQFSGNTVEEDIKPEDIPF